MALCRALALVLFVACRPLPSPPVVNPDADIIETLGACAKACTNLRALGCVEGGASPDGVSCESVCQTARAYVDPICVNKAIDVTGVRACNVRCVTP